MRTAEIRIFWFTVQKNLLINKNLEVFYAQKALLYK